MLIPCLGEVLKPKYYTFFIKWKLYIYIKPKYYSFPIKDFPGGLSIKSLLAVQETTWAQSLTEENPLEDMSTHSSALAWRIPRIEEPGGLQSVGSQELDTT